MADDFIEIEKGQPQLFVDNWLIASSEGLVRTIHSPVKDDGGEQPAIPSGKVLGKYPSTLEANSSILFDPKLGKYVMYALAFASSLDRDSPDGWQRTHLLRYTSENGLDWIAGDNGNREQVFPRERNDLYDPQSGVYATNIDLTSFYYDVEDQSLPYKGWVWFSNWGEGREGIYLVQSADGKHWQRGPQLLPAKQLTLVQDGHTMVGPGDVTTFYPDPVSGRFLATIKFTQDDNDPVTNNLFRSRAYLFLDRMDKPVNLKRIREIDLIPAGSQSGGDETYDEYYGSNAWRYGSQWLGILKVWHGRGDYPWSAAGAAYFKLASSRDGLHWHKVTFDNANGHPEVFLTNGTEGGNNGLNDGGYMTHFSEGPMRIGDELIFYYGSSSYGKNHPDDVRLTGGGIFRARLRVDGFVSVDRGTLTTHPLQIEGDELYLNSKGKVKVELLDADGKPLGSAQVSGDSIRHRLRFKGKSAGELSRDRPVRLSFSVKKGGELYSFYTE